MVIISPFRLPAVLLRVEVRVERRGRVAQLYAAVRHNPCSRNYPSPGFLCDFSVTTGPGLPLAGPIACVVTSWK